VSRTLITVAVATLLATLLGLAPAAALTSERVIRVYEPYSDDARQPSVDLDLGEKGMGPGDTFLRRETLYNSRPQFGRGRGARVGRVDVQITIFRPGTVRLAATFTFPDGTLETGGSTSLARVSITPVLGGTRAYANARGTVEIRQLPKSTSFSFNLVPLR
jgi:hypothetical protein